MRSALLAGLVLAGCNSGTKSDDVVENLLVTDGPAAAESADATVATVITVSTTDQHRNDLPKGRFQALGTEPFWSIEVLPDKLRFDSPEVDEMIFSAKEIKLGKGALYTGTMDGKVLSLLIEPGKCSDGMSDTTYDWKATLTIDGKAEQGCARLK